MHAQEQALLLSIYSNHATVGDIRRTCTSSGNYKQNLYYLGKWCKKGWYEYGVNLDLGWLTHEGKKKAQEMLQQQAPQQPNQQGQQQSQQSPFNGGAR